MPSLSINVFRSDKVLYGTVADVSAAKGLHLRRARVKYPGSLGRPRGRCVLSLTIRSPSVRVRAPRSLGSS